jgi:hypothetical protein
VGRGEFWWCGYAGPDTQLKSKKKKKKKTLGGGLGNVHYHFPPTKAVFDSMPKITNPWKNMDGIKAWTLTGVFLEHNLT